MRYPPLRYYLERGIARYGGVSRIGPLSPPSSFWYLLNPLPLPQYPTSTPRQQIIMNNEHKLSTTTTREQNRDLGPQAYGRYPDPGKHRKIIATIAFAGSAQKNWGATVVVDSSIFPDELIFPRFASFLKRLRDPNSTRKGGILSTHFALSSPQAIHAVLST